MNSRSSTNIASCGISSSCCVGNCLSSTNIWCSSSVGHSLSSSHISWWSGSISNSLSSSYVSWWSGSIGNSLSSSYISWWCCVNCFTCGVTSGNIWCSSSISDSLSSSYICWCSSCVSNRCSSSIGNSLSSGNIGRWGNIISCCIGRSCSVGSSSSVDSSSRNRYGWSAEFIFRIVNNLPLNWDIFVFFNFSLLGNILDLFFWNVLWDVLT